MTGNYLGNPIAFLAETLIGLYILAVMLRFLLQIVRADFYNPLTQVLVKITHPVLAPMRRILPSIGRADTASIVLMLALQFASLAIVLGIAGRGFNPAFLLIYSVAELISLLLNIVLVAVFIKVILSWVAPTSGHPAVGLLDSLVEPVMSPVRRMLPDLGGLDLSPIVILIGIQVLKMLLLPPIRQLALAVG